MRALILSVMSIVILGVIALLVGPSFVDWNQYKPKIITGVKEATGYDVAIGGDLNLALLPSPRLKIEKVSIAAPKRVKSETLLVLDKASVSVALLPLLSKEIQVSSVTLEKPVITLEVLPDGSPAWMTDKLAGPQQPTDPAQTPRSDSAGTQSFQGITLKDIKISGGQIEYTDYAKAAHHLLQDVNLDVSADTLKGPFKAEGSLVYNGKKAEIDIETGRIGNNTGDLNLKAKAVLPDSNASLSFSGIAGIDPDFELQGEVSAEADSLSAAMGSAAPALDQKLKLKGLLTTDPESVALRDMSFEFGPASGTGVIDIRNFKAKNPAKMTADLTVKGLVDLDRFTGGAGKASEASAQGATGVAGAPVTKSASLLPESLTLPFPLDGTVNLNIEGLKVKGQTIKGVLATIAKAGPRADISFKALEIPGGGRIESSGAVAFGSSSVSKKDGSVTYADPQMTLKATGHASKLPEFLKALGQTGPVVDVWKAAQFNISGAVKGPRVEISNSSLTLDQTQLALAGSYQPGAGTAKADVVADITAAMLDIDAIQSKMTGKPAPSVNVVTTDGQSTTMPAGDNGKGLEAALKPVREFSLPVNLTFDVSAQQARVNGMDIKGLRLKGASRGNSLNLETASAESIMGATASLRGQIASLKDLSGIDLNFYGKTSDADALMKALKVDASKLPSPIGAAEAKVALKGKIESLTFTSNISALQGQLDAAGTATNILAKPAFDDLTLAVKHPNFAKAMQLVSKDFKGSPGLEKPFDFYGKTQREGNLYSVSDLRANFGSTNLVGFVKVDTGGARPSITGNLQMGQLPLDSFLGAKTSSSPASASGAPSSAPATSSSAGRWSSAPLQTEWMRSADMDLQLAAKNITYGGWNFEQPSTRITLKDGALNVSKMTAGLFGGQVDMDAQVQSGAKAGDAVSLAVKADMDNVAAESLAYALSGSKRLQAQGTVSLNMDVKGAGGSSAALVSALAGTANLDGRSIILEGFDLAKMARGLSEDEKIGDSVQSLLSGSISGGQTQFDTIKGAYDINKGIVQISSMAMDGPEAVIKSTGHVSLPAWTIDTAHEISLKKVTDLAPFKVSIKGSLSNPANTFGKGVLEDYINRKIQRKVAKEIPKLLGDDVSEKLEKFGILPQQKQPVDVPAEQQPAAGDEGWADPSQAAPAPAQPAQPPAPQPAPTTPEDALKGVLEGLMKKN